MFKVIIKPNPVAGPSSYSAMADLQETVEQPEFLAKVVELSPAGATPINVEIVTRVIQGLFAAILFYMRQTRPVAAILGLFRVRPTCGGSYGTPTPDDGDLRENVDFSLLPLPQVKVDLRDELPIQISGQVGLAAPFITSVTALPGGQGNAFHQGGGMEVRGKHMHNDNPAIAPTARLLKLDNTLAVACVVMDSSDRRAMISVPPGTLAATYILEYSSKPGDSSYTVRYNVALTPV